MKRKGIQHETPIGWEALTDGGAGVSADLLASRTVGEPGAPSDTSFWNAREACLLPIGCPKFDDVPGDEQLFDRHEDADSSNEQVWI